MKSHFRTTTEETFLGKTFEVDRYTEKYVQNLEDMDITSSFTPDVEPSGEGRNKTSPHVLIELDEDHFVKIKSIQDDVNQKYFEMGGDNSNGYLRLTDILEKILERELEDPDIEEKYMEEMEEEIREERVNNE